MAANFVAQLEAFSVDICFVVSSSLGAAPADASSQQLCSLARVPRWLLGG